MIPQVQRLAADLNPWPGTDAGLSIDNESMPDVGAADSRSEFATTSVNDEALVLAIRHAAHVAQSLLPSQARCSNDEHGQFCALAPGAEIADFRLIRELGTGAFARVFLAFHKSMQRLVAIKFSTLPSNEPKLLSTLDHRNIVRVYHYDDRCLLETGVYLLFMEYVPGVDLKRLLQDARSVPIEERSAWLASYLAKTASDSLWRERMALPPQLASASWAEVVAWIGARIADALAYAHRQDVVHRDIKPGNVLLRTDGNPMLVDFNVGFGEQVWGARPEDCFGGSLAYMAPEQRSAFYCRGDYAAVDNRCDIYSLGVLLYELLTGRLPDAQRRKPLATGNLADNQLEPVASEYYGSSSSPRDLGECPVGLRDIVLRCMAPEVSDRPRSADFVARRLQICSSPELHDFVFAPIGSWSSMVSRYPLFALLTFVLAPNAFFAVLNIAFVDRYVSGEFYREVPPHWTVAIGYFNFQKIVVNAIVFPLGLCVAACLAHPFVRGFRPASGSELGREHPPTRSSEHQITWRYAGRLGYYVWFVTLGCWIGTGFVFPTWNSLAKLHYTEVALTPRDFATFSMTQATFGCLASALSVLGVNYVLMRYLLPVLVRDDCVPRAGCLDPIKNQVQRMVHWLAFLPQFSLLAVALLIADPNPILFVMLGLVSGGCYGCSILYARTIRRAESRLRALLAPTEELLYGNK